MTKEQATRREVIRNLPHFWGYVIGSGLIALFLQLVGLIPPIIMQNIVDFYIPNQDIKELCMGILWFVLVPILSTGVAAYYKYKIAVVCRKFGQQLTLSGFERIMAQPLSFFEDQNSAELTSYCRKESVQYVNFWIAVVPGLIAGILQGIVIFICLARVNLLLAIVALLYCPISYFPSNYFGKKTQALGKRITVNNGKMSQIITETFQGIQFVKSMAIEKARTLKLKKVNEDTVSIWAKVAFLDNMTFLWVNDFSNTLFLGVTFALGAFFAIKGQTTVGELILILNYVGKFFGAAQTAMRANYNFKVELGEYDKMFEILTLPIPDEGNGKRAFSYECSITFQDVAFCYRADRGQVLNRLNFVINKGEWLGIVGQSGAGKTTILDLLMRLYDPQAGRILIDGVPIFEYTLNSLRNGITKVSQETMLFPGTIRENLLLVNGSATEKELTQVLEQVCLKDFVANLQDGLDTVIGEGGLMLSGGERQRLGLAQGLLRKSSLILIDEVTANVDQESEAIIRSLLHDLSKNEGLTIVSISHRPEFLAESDRILVLKDGGIYEETTYAEKYLEK